MKTFKEFMEDKSFGKQVVQKLFKTAMSVTKPPKIRNPIYAIKRKVKSAYYTPKPPQQ